MNYSQVLTLIDTNLASASNITAVKHREVETALLDYGQTQNNYVGFMSGINLPIADGVSLTVSGDIDTAVGATNKRVLVTLTTPMPTLNYYVRFYVESLGVSDQDGQVACPMFQKISTTQFYYIQLETAGSPQNLKVHVEVISLD
tara:strand:+ start:6464 stop:6898 length:435 start_codon:yes stop_codon:yes gene_type:complete